MNKEYNNILYFSLINSIGGVESFFYYLVKKYNDYDLTIFYKKGDFRQIKRLQKFCRVVKYNGEKIKCKKAFFNYNIDIIDNVEAEDYYSIIHCDYNHVSFKPIVHPKINHYIGVSKLACDAFEEKTGIKCECIYNPILLDEPKRILHLISATRLTKEKGRNRIIKLGELLDKGRIPYIWTIFTDSPDLIDNPNIIYMKPKLDISSYIADADALVQLSDCESYCYSIVEALMLGTEVITTDLPVLKELGVKDGVNGWICDFDMSNVDVEKIYNTPLNFKYEPPKDTWGEMLVKGKKEYKAENEDMNVVEATEKFSYSRFNELQHLQRYNNKNNIDGILCEGDIFECSDEIMNYLLNNKVTNGANRPLIRVLLYKDE